MWSKSLKTVSLIQRIYLYMKGAEGAEGAKGTNQRNLIQVTSNASNEDLWKFGKSAGGEEAREGKSQMNKRSGFARSA